MKWALTVTSYLIQSLSMNMYKCSSLDNNLESGPICICKKLVKKVKNILN